MSRTLQEQGYTELRQTVPLTQEEYQQWRRVFRMSDHMKRRLHELICDLITESMVAEEEVWDEIAVKLERERGDEDTAVDIDWVGRVIRLWVKPKGKAGAAIKEAGRGE